MRRLLFELALKDEKKACAKAFYDASPNPKDPDIRDLVMRGGSAIAASHVYDTLSLGGGGKEVYPAFLGFASTAACGAKKECPLGAVLQARILGIAGEPTMAHEVLSRALARTADLRLLGLLRMTKGDLLASPHGFPEELDLPFPNLASTMHLASGQAKRDAFAKVGGSSAELLEAKHWYGLADQAFRDTSCARCRTDLAVRDAYLEYVRAFRAETEASANSPLEDEEAEVHLAAAFQGFSQARERFVALGDKLAGDRLVFCLVVVGTAEHQGQQVGALVKQTIDGFPADSRRSAAANLVDLLSRASRRQHLAGDADGAISFARIGADIAEKLTLGGQEWALRTRQAEVSAYYGLTREGIEILNRLLDKPRPTIGDSVDRHLYQTSALLAVTTLHGLYLQLGNWRKANETQERHRDLQSYFPKQLSFYSTLLDQEETNDRNAYDEGVARAQTDGDLLNEAMARLRRLRHHCPDHDVRAPQLRDAAEAFRLVAAERADVLRRLKEGLLSRNLEREWQVKTLPSPILDRGKRDPRVQDLAKQELRSRLSQLVTLLVRLKQYAEARRTVALAAPYYPAGVLTNSDEPWEESGELAEIAEGLGDLDEALGLYQGAVGQIEKLVPVIKASSSEDDSREGEWWIYGGMTRLLVKRALAGKARPEQPLVFLENWRGRQFRARVAVAALGAGGGAFKEFRTLVELGAQKETVRRDFSDKTLTGTERSNLKTKLDDLERRMGVISTGSEQPPPVTAWTEDTLSARLQSVLKSSDATALVSYFVDSEIAVAWVLTSGGGVTLRRLPTTREELNRINRQLFDALQHRGDTTWKDPARKLHARLIAPLQDLLPTAGSPHARIGLVPHAVLQGVPFQVLLAGDRPLVESYAVFYLPTIGSYADVRDLSAGRPGRGRVAAFGFNGKDKDLTEAEAEAWDLGTPPARFVGPRATKQAFLHAAAGAFDVLHVAAHAQVSSENPFHSSIQLFDGPMELSQLATFVPRRIRLVTLSACQTAVGETTRLENTTGLAWAILAAGVPASVASLWPVDDIKTHKLMKDFYSGIKHGDTAEALAAAQRRAVGDGLHPFYWGAFSLLGADR